MLIRSQEVEPTAGLESRVFEAARHLFYTKGYYATTTREIAARAKTSEAGVFRKFPTKYSLLMAVYNDAWRRINDSVAGRTQHDDPRMEILTIFTDLATIYDSDPLTAAFVLINTGNTDTLLIERKDEAIISPENTRYIEHLRALCKAAVDRKLVSPSFTPNSLTESVLGIFEGTLLGWYLADNSKDYLNNVTDTFSDKVSIEEMTLILRHLLSLETTSEYNLPLMKQYLPATPVEMNDVATRLLALSGEDIAISISELRDFAERERYRLKDELDEYLLKAPETSAKRQEIENIFEGEDLIDSAAAYLDSYLIDMRALHAVHVDAAITSVKYTLAEWKRFWTKVAPLADTDNAHAMYLSSDNWPFSVFHKLLARLEELVPSELESEFSDLLTAGIQDPRMFVYHAFAGNSPSAERPAFVQRMLREQPLVLQNGVMPIFAYEASRSQPSRGRSASVLVNDFERASRVVKNRVTPTQALRFTATSHAYRNLTAARIAYDSYEYFGFYAFVRHYLIIQCSKVVGQKSPEKADAFKRKAAMYEFSEAVSILNN
jgi:AcrR family transcriptional regulator